MTDPDLAGGGGTVILGRSEIASVITIAEAIAVVEEALVAHGRGVAPAAAETLTAVGEIAVLADRDGATLAILDAAMIAALRAGAVSAVASKFLAVGTPRSIGLIGCGLQARRLLEAHQVVFAPREIRCADTRPEIAALFANACGGRVTSVEEAAACDIVCTSTASSTPVVRRAWIRMGTHLNVMGASGLHELDDDVLAGVKLVLGVAPTIPAATPVWGTLGEVAAGIKDGRELDEVTVFDATGTQRHDLAIARVVHAAARRRHVGPVMDLQC